ncbi:MAG: DUF3572 family protein [Salinarimonadaceae bacterium]|nr:MAG: DUF3572 family protein [Salinarimonadaceae bacterium]
MANRMKNRAQSLSKEEAHDVAVAVFGRIAADDERLGRLLDLTGLRPDTIRAAAASPRFFEAVLEHVVGYEPLLIEIARELAMRPEAIVAAHARLAPAPLD